MLLLIGIFVVLFAAFVLSLGLGRSFLVSQQKKQIRAMLHRANTEAGKRRPDLLRDEQSEDALSKALHGIAFFDRIALLTEQAGLKWTSAKFLIMSIAAAGLGCFVGVNGPHLPYPGLLPLILAVFFGSIPLMYVLKKRAKRMAAFEEQFPEALNFLGRSMRAGHAFSIGLEMLVADASEPLGSSFRRVLNDLHLGSSMDTALGKLVDLVPSIDVRFFVSAVLLQQGTGGNLSEILDTMAHIMRERCKLKGQVRAHAAHGKITGLVLSIMPIVVGILLFFLSPGYLMILFQEQIGRNLLIGAAVGQLVGYFVIRKLVDIKV
jgi:tight adherence protein B